MGDLMNKLIKKIFGIDKIEEETRKAIEESEKAKKIAEDALDSAEKAKEEERIAKLSPKEIANEKGEPYIAVVDTKINESNVRNGFFELDWNEHFVVQLRLSGYRGETEEAVVDQWFQDLCRNIGSEEGVDMTRRGSGYININNLGEGKAEIS